MSSVPERPEIDEEYKWDLESIYATDEEWEEAYEEAESLVEELETYEGRVAESGETLRSVLELYEETMRLVSQVAAYAQMRSHEDTRVDEYQAMTGRAGSLRSAASSASSYLEPELQSLDREELDAMIDETEGLELYEHYFDDVLRSKPHTRSTEVENLLAELGEVTDAPGEIYSMLTNADMTFPSVEDSEGEAVEISLSNFTSLQKRPNRQFRRDVYEAFYDEWGTVENAVATAYEKNVRRNVKLARARNFDTAREAALHGPNVPVEVYDTLVDTVHDNLDVLQRHADLKRRAIGADELRMWDLYAPMTGDENPEVPYEEAREHVVDALGALGGDYQQRVADGLDSRWIDVYENQGKRSGAYSGGTYDTQPFVLMNYQDDVASMYTLAHELGHSLHSQLTSEQQPYVYSGYTIFVAEVASTVNEALLTDHLLDTVEDEAFRRAILDEYLERFRSTLFRQTMFADFEHQVHERIEDGEALTPDRIHELYGDLKSEFYANAAVDDRIATEWMRIPHFYSAFYVFQYSTGISAAVALAREILDGDGDATDRYLSFLERGSRAYPIELLADAGVDMTSADPVERAIETYDGHLDEMAALVE